MVGFLFRIRVALAVLFAPVGAQIVVEISPGPPDRDKCSPGVSVDGGPYQPL